MLQCKTIETQCMQCGEDRGVSVADAFKREPALEDFCKCNNRCTQARAKRLERENGDLMKSLARWKACADGFEHQADYLRGQVDYLQSQLSAAMENIPRPKRDQVPPKLRWAVIFRDNKTCQYCGRKAPDVVLHVDHVVSVADGGATDEGNLVTACEECNFGKGRRSA